jgi:hypothetical protein
MIGTGQRKQYAIQPAQDVTGFAHVFARGRGFLPNSVSYNFVLFLP